MGIPSSSKSKSKGKYQKGIDVAKQLLVSLGKDDSLMLGEVLVTQGYHDEIYVAVKPKHIAQPWVWLNPSIVSGDKSFKRAFLESDQAMQIQQFVTGSCLFGDGLIADTNNGSVVCLTDSSLSGLDDQVMVSVKETTKKHAYELLIHKQLDLLFPILQCMTGKGFNIQFHLPMPEYILQGIAWYQQEKMTLSALQSYIVAVVHRAHTHKMLLRAFTLQTGCLVIASSPLDCLQLQTLKTMSLDELEDAVSCISMDILQYDLLKDVHWQHVLSHQSIKSFRDLNYLSYVVHVAQHAKESLKTAVIDISNEKPICAQYEKLFADGEAVFGLHYQPAVLPENTIGSWYFTDKQEAALTKLIRSGAYEKVAETQQLTTLSPLS